MPRTELTAEIIDVVLDLCKERDEWYRIERRGRELAARGGLVTGEVSGVVDDMASVVQVIAVDLDESMPYLAQDLNRAYAALSEIYMFFKNAVGFYSMTDPCERVYGWEPYTRRSVGELERSIKEITGKKCLWAYGKVPPSGYTLALLLNDVTSCFHRLIDWFTTKLCPTHHLGAKVVAVEGYSKTLAQYALWWDAATEALFDAGIYASEDYPAIGALVKSDEVEFRVGSSPGHATHCERKPVGLRCIYYDTDADVNSTMALLARMHRVEVEEIDEVDHVTFFVYWDKAKRFFTGVLPFATSMDFRIGNPEHYWGTDWAAKALETIDGPGIWPPSHRGAVPIARRMIRHALYGEEPPEQCTWYGVASLEYCPDEVRELIEAALCLWAYKNIVKPRVG